MYDEKGKSSFFPVPILYAIQFFPVSQKNKIEKNSAPAVFPLHRFQ